MRSKEVSLRSKKIIKEYLKMIKERDKKEKINLNDKDTRNSMKIIRESIKKLIKGNIKWIIKKIKKGRREMTILESDLENYEYYKHGVTPNEAKKDKKKIKELYKNGKIYRIKSKIDELIYVGSTVLSIELKFLKHMLVKKEKEKRLYKYFKKIGWENAEVEIIEKYECNNDNDLKKRVKEYYDEIKEEYRLNKKGEKKRKYNEKNKKVKKRFEDKIRKGKKTKIKEWAKYIKVIKWNNLKELLEGLNDRNDEILENKDNEESASDDNKKKNKFI